MFLPSGASEFRSPGGTTQLSPVSPREPEGWRALRCYTTARSHGEGRLRGNRYDPLPVSLYTENRGATFQ